jgi:hypothetical protein
MRIEIGLQVLGLKSRELWAKRLQVARRWRFATLWSVVGLAPLRARQIAAKATVRIASYHSLPQTYTGLAPAAAAIAAVSLLTFEIGVVAG